MAQHGKKYIQAAEKVDRQKYYAPLEALQLDALELTWDGVAYGRTGPVSGIAAAAASATPTVPANTPPLAATPPTSATGCGTNSCRCLKRTTRKSDRSCGARLSDLADRDVDLRRGRPGAGGGVLLCPVHAQILTLAAGAIFGLGFIALWWGWRYAFVAGGALGLVWVVVWAIVYRRPRDHPWLSAKELALIEADRPAAEEKAAHVPIARLLRMRETWGCILARALTDPISYFFFFWTPKFLQTERGFTLADIAAYSWIPFVAGAVGNVMGGAVPTWNARKWPTNVARALASPGAPEHRWPA